MDYGINDSSMGINIATIYDTTTETEVSQNPIKESLSIEKYMNGILAIFIIGLGLVGNTLTVIVLTKRTMRSSTNCYLTALAIWDAFVLLGTLFLITLPQLSDGFKHNVFAYVAVYIYPFALVAQTATLWLTVSFTVERYIAVCHPLKAAQMCTIPRARLVISFVSIISFLFNISRWFDYSIMYVTDNVTNVTMVHYKQTEFGEDGVYREVYFLWLYLFIMFFIPLSSLAILNAFLIHAVKLSQKQRKDMNVRQHRENNVTIMLVSVVIVFMICQVPALIYNVAYAVDMINVHKTYAWQVLSTVRNFMVTCNSAINFMLYCAFGQKFRRTFMKTFCVKCIKEENFNSYMYPHSTILASTTTIGHSKYRVYRGKHVPHVEMADICASTTTHTTLLSKYSPHSSNNTTPIHVINRANYTENGKLTNVPVNDAKRNGEKLKEVYGSDIDDDHEDDDVTTKMIKHSNDPVSRV